MIGAISAKRRAAEVTQTTPSDAKSTLTPEVKH